MTDELSIRDLNATEIEAVAGAGCRTEIRIRCDTSGQCYAEAVLICEIQNN